MSFVPIPPNELAGVVVVNIFVIFSMLALVSVALRAVWLLIRPHLLITALRKREHIFFFNTHFGQYGACLLLAMTLSTTGGMIGIFWLAQRGITEGWVCRIQATLMQIGTCSAAYFTVTISLHTFSSLVLRMRQSVIYCRSTMIIGWIFAISVGSIPFVIHLPHGHVYGENGFTCGVRSVYPKTLFFLHLLPILIGSFLSAILYSLIFLALRGMLKIRGGIKFTLDPEVRWNNCEENALLARVASSMLWYSLAYIVLLVPYSIVRLLVISGYAVSFKAIVFAYVCWFSLGVVIVFLLYNTFRILGSILPPPCKDSIKTLSRRRQNFEYLDPLSSPTSWISWYRKTDFLPSRSGSTKTSSTSFMLDPSPLHQDRSSTIPLSPPAFDYNHTITPPPSASLSSHSDMGRRDRESAPLLAAGIPSPRQSRFAGLLKPRQALGVYGNFVPNNNHIVIHQQSTRTIDHDSSSSGITSWSQWTTQSSSSGYYAI